jgi:hypothetical protein
VATLAEWLEGEDDLIRDRITELIHRRGEWALAFLILKSPLVCLCQSAVILSSGSGYEALLMKL